MQQQRQQPPRRSTMMVKSSSSSSSAATTSVSGKIIIFTFFLLSFAASPYVVLADPGGLFTHTIPFGSEECLLIRVPKGRPHVLSGSFDVVDFRRAATEPIRVALYGPDEIRLWGSEYGDIEGSFGIVSNQGGKHWLCLENGMTYEHAEDMETHHQIERTIGFSLRIRSTGEVVSTIGGGENGVAGPATEAENAIGAAVQRLSLLSQNLLTNLESLSDQTAYMKAREAMQRNLHEETFANVMRWNLLEMLVVAIVSLGQVANVWWILSKRKRMDRNSYY